MKKIALLVYDVSKIGGAERVSCTIANELVNDYDVYIISMIHRFGKIPYDLDKKIHYTFINENINYRLRDLIIHSRKKLRKILKDEKIDVMMSMGVYSGLVGAINAFDLPTKVIFCDHGAIASQIDDKTITMARKISCRLSNHSVLLTDKSYQKYIELFKISKNKLSVIYNWVDDKIFKYVKKYNNNSNKIISVSRIAEEKGIDMLIEVAKILKEKNQNWTWDVYGDGPEMENVKKKLTKLDLDHFVFLKGQENRIYEKYSEYSIFVLTSYREGLPLVLLEAKANNLPLISFDIDTGPNEIIKNNVNGYLINPYDKNEMASKINELLNDKVKRKKFSDNASIDLEKFEKKEIVKKWKHLINKL